MVELRLTLLSVYAVGRLRSYYVSKKFNSSRPRRTCNQYAETPGEARCQLPLQAVQHLY